MNSISIEEAQQKLVELIKSLPPGEDLMITRDHQPVARLVAEQPPTSKARVPGGAKGKLFIVAEDDDHLSNFKECMP
jgi:antitoxin (DNA-binding transcriptional repressor) of toxin-antitoxin stability system